MKTKLPIQAALQFGWEQFKAQPGLWIGTTLTIFMVSYLPSFLQLLTDRWSIIVGVNVVAAALGLVLTLGIIQLTLKAYRQEKLQWADLWSQIPLLFKYFLANLIFTILVVVGLILFIVPGIILTLRLFYFSYFMVDQKLSTMAALQASWSLTRGRAGGLFLLCLAQYGIILLGLMALGVGLFIAMPVIILAETYIYQFLRESSADAKIAG